VLAATMLLLGGASPAAAQPETNPWTRVSRPTANQSDDIEVQQGAFYTLNRPALAAELAKAPPENAGAASTPLVVVLPAPDGTFQRFDLADSPVMEPGLAAAHPEIKTYDGKGVDDPGATIRADLTPLGFHASVRSPHGAWYIDP